MDIKRSLLFLGQGIAAVQANTNRFPVYRSRAIQIVLWEGGVGVAEEF